MHSAATVLLSFAALAVGSPAPTPAKAPEPMLPRQTDSGLLNNLFKLADAFEVNSCIPYALPLVGQLPPIPKGLVGNDLVTQALSQTTLPLSGVCDFSVTGSVGTQFSEFLPVWYSWYGDKSETIQSIISHCSKATALIATVEAFTSCAQYKSATATFTGGEGSSATTTSEADSSSSSDDSDSTSAAETTTATEEATSSEDSGSEDSSTSAPSSEATAPSETSSEAASSPTESTVAEGDASKVSGVHMAAALAAGVVGVMAAL